ncbi:hypothetical protein C4578_01350 [Candidatus Microgenomates bacterium]|jgi:hypothetical protein|nr:MAG: hypothetical protein C4578_01350 [Candidatus Microgenomates bacterium]
MSEREDDRVAKSIEAFKKILGPEAADAFMGALKIIVHKNGGKIGISQVGDIVKLHLPINGTGVDVSFQKTSDPQKTS